jgi:hypothetical protein
MTPRMPWNDSAWVTSQYIKGYDIDMPKCKRMCDEERTWAVNVEPFVRTKKERTTAAMLKRDIAASHLLASLGAFRSGAANLDPVAL